MNIALEFIRAIPSAAVRSISEWGKQFVNLPSSAMSRTFDPDLTPWNKEPLDSTDLLERRKTVFIKPIQGGGSVIGEVLLCYWLATKSSGDVQYNWQNDEQADARWDKRVERILKGCQPVESRWPKERNKTIRGQVLFPHCNFTMQGVLTNRNVASDSIKYQINEECHDEEGWLPGRLEQAFGRTTAHWDHSIVVISNAGRKDSELHQKFEDGTQQQWQVKCPGCGLFHEMHTEWDEKRPDLGGLRYDADDARLDGGRYDYQKIQPTVRYQMPCGYTVHDLDRATRRQMSLGGCYSEPKNLGAPDSIASYTLEAVAIDYISWLDLIMQKHAALRALKYGNIKPWLKYKKERECIFVDEEDRPFYQSVILSDRKKDRAGLKDRTARLAQLDRQQGSLAKGELPHWWQTIFDVKWDGARLHVLLVFEGKMLTDEDAVETLKRHEVPPSAVVVDSGDDTRHVYAFCLRHGYNAIKGADNEFSHPDGTKKIFSVEKPLHALINAPNTRANPNEEPMFWHYSKFGIRDRWNWMRKQGNEVVTWETPGDVSKDYVLHMAAEELVEKRNKDGEIRNEWIQRKDRNDLFVCTCYAAMQIEMCGWLEV
ncbi:MAG: phage terminase large subunit family protein [Verrucomicrobiota bacterium]